jgi:hypothetical protein
MGSIRLVVGIVACVTAMSVVSSAQSRLFVFGGAGGAEVSLETGVIRAVDTNGLFAQEIVDGGRYLAALVQLASTSSARRYGLRVWSPRLGETFTPVEFVGGTSDSDQPTLVGDANHARVFVWNLDTVTAVSTSGVEDIVSNVTPPPPGLGVFLRGPRRMAYAPVAEVLFVVRQGAETEDIELAQYSTDGTLLRVIPLPAAPAYVAATSDGRRIFTVTFSTLSSATLTSYDALTGAEEGSVQLLPGEALGSGPRGLLLDETGERVLIPSGPTGNFVEVRSFELALLQDIRYPTGQTLCRFDVALDERTGAAAIASTEWHGAFFFGAKNPHVSLVNLATGAVIASAPLTNPLLDAENRCGAGAVVLTPPPAPSLEPPVIAGGAVTLTWSAVRMATDYQIEAGPAPGATVFTARTNGNLSLTVSAVPPGTYYVRLRALNDSGVSEASSEIIVTVP